MLILPLRLTLQSAGQVQLKQKKILVGKALLLVVTHGVLLKQLNFVESHATDYSFLHIMQQPEQKVLQKHL